MGNASFVATKTPMRITLAGGGTDVIWYSRLKGGAWISAAIDRYVYVTASENNNRIPINNIIRECFTSAGINRKLGIESKSDVLPQSGLGGSGAFEVGLLHALTIYKGEKTDREKLARMAADIEINRLKMPVGPQDQYIAALGGIKYFEIDTAGNVSYADLLLSPSTLKSLQKNLLFFSTGIRKDTTAILTDEEKKSKAENSNEVITVLDEIKSLGLAAKKYLLGGKTDDFGRTLQTHWHLKKRLSTKVTAPQIDKWYNEAINWGSLGGKIMGAGGGGWFIFYINQNHADFIKHMEQSGLHHEKVNFDWKGTQLITA